jgi:hypothetical protein
MPQVRTNNNQRKPIKSFIPELAEVRAKTTNASRSDIKDNRAAESQAASRRKSSAKPV